MSSFGYKFPVEDVSVSSNVNNMRKIFLFYSSNVFRQYVLGNWRAQFNLPLSFFSLSDGRCFKVL